MPAQKTTKTQNKSDFIRKQPATLSAAEVVAKAKVEGITIRPGLVYEVRRTAKSKTTAAKKTRMPSETPSPTKSPPTTAAKTPRKSPSVPRPVATTSKAETLLLAVAAEMGLGKAVEILAGERARVREVIGG